MATARAVGIWGCVLGLVLALTTSEAWAVDRWWKIQQGYWHYADNWEPSTSYPTSLDTAIVDNGGTVKFNTSITAYCGSLQLGTGEPNSGCILMDYPGNLNVSKIEGLGDGDMYVGGAGIGSFVQKTGNAHIFGQVQLGESSQGRGYLELSEGDPQFQSEDWVYVGYRGQGTFGQTAGDSYLATGIVAGKEPNSSGLISLVGGTMYTGDEVALCISSGAQGSFVLGGTGYCGAQVIFVGKGGAGAFTQTGGESQVAALCLGHVSGAAGRYDLVDGYLKVGTGDESGIMLLGHGGRGTFVKSGGLHEVTQGLRVGCEADSYGSYELRGGSLVVGSGAYQDGLYVGYGGDAQGLCTQSTDSAASFAVINGTVWVGYGPGAQGSYNLGGGLLTGGCLMVGVGGTGTVRQDGGCVSVNRVVVGGSLNQAPGDGGFYNLFGGSLCTTDAVIGEWSDGYLHQQTAYFEVDNTFTVGAHDGSRGTYVNDDGLATFGDVVVGDAGEAWFGQSAGDVIVQGTLMLGNQSTSRGTYCMEHGGLYADTILAGDGEAVFWMEGGTLPYGGTFGPKMLLYGGVLEPDGSATGTIHFDYTPDSYVQDYSGQLDISFNNDIYYGGVPDELSMAGDCHLGGIFKAVLQSNVSARPKNRYDQFTLIDANAVTGDFAAFQARYADGNQIDPNSYNSTDPNDPNGYGMFCGQVMDDPSDAGKKIYRLMFLGYAMGDLNGNNAVNSGDLSLLTGNWGATSGVTWREGDLDGDGGVNSGDLSLLTGNWGWTGSNPWTDGGGDGGGGDEYLPELKDRDGDGDFDIDDVHIILKELGMDPTDDSKDSADQDGGQDGDGWQSSIFGGSSWLSSGARYARLAALSPLTWFGVLWLGCTIHALARPRRN